MKKRVIISVISDLVTDQRVHRTATVFSEMGYDGTLIGRRLTASAEVGNRPYKALRFNLLFDTGPFFYASYNIRLFIYLLFNRAGILVANDLDTLLPNFLVSKIKGSRLIYDSHEYFTGVPELEGRPFVRGTWKKIEKFIFPRLSYIITVNDSIAALYYNEYGRKITVVRNIPDVSEIQITGDPESMKKEAGIPSGKKIIVMQGSGINVDRGGEEAVLAMEFVNNAVLLLIGSGDVIGTLKQMSQAPALKGKIIFMDKMPFSRMMQYTCMADIGLTLDKDTNINYRYSLPNKLFDYIHAGIAVLGTGLVEVRNIVEGFQCGTVIEKLTPQTLSEKINFMLSDEKRLQLWKANAVKASSELSWENEKKNITGLIDELQR